MFNATSWILISGILISLYFSINGAIEKSFEKTISWFIIMCIITFIMSGYDKYRNTGSWWS